MQEGACILAKIASCAVVAAYNQQVGVKIPDRFGYSLCGIAGPTNVCVTIPASL